MVPRSGATMRTASPFFVAQPLLDQGRVVECRGQQEFFGRLALLVIELLDCGADQFFVARLIGLRPKEVLAPDQQPAAHEEQLQVGGGSLAGEADHVLVDGGDLGDALFLQGPLDAEQPVPQPCGLLEGLPFRRPFHFRPQTVEQFAIAPLQELADLSHDGMVLLPRLVADAGRHAAFDLELDAGAVGLAVDVDLAGGQRKHLPDHLQGFTQGTAGV